MTKKIFTFLLLIAFHSLTVHAQLKLREPAVSYGKIDSDSFAISLHPVTNKEYIIYLVWLNNVYGPEYPDIVYNSLPGLKRDTLQKLFSLNRKHLLDNTDSIFKYSEPYIKEYMFNLKYLDYPVIGIKWQDANNYCKWLSDRYNEMLLIKKGELGFQINPTQNDFFYSELFLIEKWQGQTKTGKNIPLSDNFFVPTFRLPTKRELIAADTKNAVSSELKAYPLTKNNVLYKWYKQYFSDVTDTSYIIHGYANHSYYYPLTVRSCKNCKKFDTATSLEEQYLDINNKVGATSLNVIYKQNGQNRIALEDISSHCCPDSTMAPYIMIGEEANKPIIVSGYRDFEIPKNKSYTFFRFACSVKENIKNKH